jgi:hypothetical protein
MGDQNVLSRAPPCFGRRVKLLVPVFAIVCIHSSTRKVDVRQKAGRKIVAESLSQYDEIHVVLNPLKWDKGKKKKKKKKIVLLLSA